MPKKNQTTSKDFQLFSKEIKKWQIKLGLLDWRIDLFHLDAEEFVSRGWTNIKDGNFIASIGLAVNWGEDTVTNKTLKETAIHEILHVLLADLCYFAEHRNTPAGLVDNEEHRIIRRLESVLTGKSG